MTLLWAAFILGCAFGAAARLGRFCLLRGLRQSLGLDADEAAGRAPALQAFALALALALLASQALSFTGLIDLNQAAVVRSDFSVFGVVLGGMLFGLGMVLARSCGARALVLLAGGNLRSLLTLLFLGLGAQATMTGLLAPLRQWLQSLAPVALNHASLPAQLQASGLSPMLSLALTVGLPALLLLAYALYKPALRQSWLQLATALLIGLLVAAGWWITAHVGVDEFEPVRLTSLSFVGPVSEALLYLQLAVGRDLSLGPALAAGVLTGAFFTALLSRSAHWEGFDSPTQMATTALGGLLMGFGGVLAAGCSIGQGLTGLSTLAFASFPAVFGIVLAALLSLKLQSFLKN